MKHTPERIAIFRDFRRHKEYLLKAIRSSSYSKTTEYDFLRTYQLGEHSQPEPRRTGSSLGWRGNRLSDDGIGNFFAVMSSWIALKWHPGMMTAFYTNHIKSKYVRIFVKIIKEIIKIHIQKCILP